MMPALNPKNPPPVSNAPTLPDCNIVELRQYTLHPGQRDVLINLFDRELVETQEASGMTVMGQFRDLDDPDRFVWLRAFADMPGRQAALGAFYGGPVWQAHREAANATMVDVDNVLLLRPAWPGSGISMQGRRRAARTSALMPDGLLDARVFPLARVASVELLEWCRQTMTPKLEHAGARVLGWYVSEPAFNNFPRLPVREGEDVLVGFAMFPDIAAADAFARGAAQAPQAQPQPGHWRAGPTQVLRLAPTARSAIHL
jgi:NIPSNAP